MILWTTITGFLAYGSLNADNAGAKKAARVLLTAWALLSVGLYAIGGPAID